jgi:hypothetical protein
MGKVEGLDRTNSEMLAFSIACLTASAIDRAEFQQWLQQLILENDVENLPQYIFDLEQYSGPLPGIFKIIGFVPSWKHSEKDRFALYGIASKRGRYMRDLPGREEDAREVLARNKQIENRFRKMFPFVIW